jgi:hypothetical protein
MSAVLAAGDALVLQRVLPPVRGFHTLGFDLSTPGMCNVLTAVCCLASFSPLQETRWFFDAFFSLSVFCIH